MNIEKLIVRLAEEGAHGDIAALEDAIQLCYNLREENQITVANGKEPDKVIYDEVNFAKAHEGITKIRSACLECMRNGGGQDAVDLYYKTHLFDAPFVFDSFMLYIEKNRQPERQYWLPRRKKLLYLAEALQDLEYDKLDELFLSMPPRIGKSTLIMFFCIWVMLRNSERSNLYCSYTQSVVETFYNGLLEIFNDPVTYKWREVFPTAKIASTNSKEMTLNIDRRKRYSSITVKSLWGSLNGSCDIGGSGDNNGYLIGDDLISGIEEAMSKDRLDKAYLQVTNNLLPRDNTGNAKKLWIGTRWAQGDPYGRRLELLENDEHFKGHRWKVINVPALDDNDESNFDYDYGIGFTTEAYKRIRAQFERNNTYADWCAQYMGVPIDRVGSVFEPDDLRYFNGNLPDQDPDRIYMAVDPAWGGGDYVAAPVCYQYDDDIYIPDVVYDNRDKFVTWSLLVAAIEKWHVQAVTVEATKATSSYSEGLSDRLKQKGIKINVTSSTKNWTMTGKTQRIFDKAPDIRQRMIFLASGNRSKDYERFMANVYAFKITGNVKKQSDDAPDSLAQAINMAFFAPAKVVVMNRFF